MPQNVSIEINCKWRKCYWNTGKYRNNCARPYVEIKETYCTNFITQEAAKQLLEIAGSADAQPNSITKGGENE